ncbi:SDR family oxidoreductase [Pseudonocardia sp. TRM90224]|uniref:SDR family oxidoreductase n=1 Tax=Pseudonocardia sp. TRM90224 TaxID=2812678 RepID=UPI001E58B440|nr:SDR family oxidoreductase [Pseudonocardia sp. TRM90224]
MPSPGTDVALVTGATGGIGRAVTALLHDRGWTVAAADLTAPPASAGVHPMTVDVTDPVSVERLVDDVEQALGPIAVLVSVAGVLLPASLLDTTDAEWERTFDVNASGVFRLLRAVATRMVPRGRGSIVTVASNAGRVPRTGVAAYAASKAAAAQLTRCVGLELAEHGIRANVVCPGSTDTAMLRGLHRLDDTNGAAVSAAISAAIAGAPEQFRIGIPLGRVAAPADVAEAVAYLASDAARHVTMQELYVDGGASLR